MSNGLRIIWSRVRIKCWLMNESELLHNILQRDRRAILTFYKRYTPRLTRFIRSKVGNSEDAQEVLQDTLYAFLEALRDFQGQSKIETFLYAICGHKIIDYYRRKKVKHVVFSLVPRLEQILSPGATPESELDAVFVRQKIEQVLRGLMPLYRRVLVLKYKEGRSVAEVASLCETTLKGAESVLFRARRAFVKAFVAI